MSRFSSSYARPILERHPCRRRCRNGSKQKFGDNYIIGSFGQVANSITQRTTGQRTADICVTRTGGVKCVQWIANWARAAALTSYGRSLERRQRYPGSMFRAETRPTRRILSVSEYPDRE